MPDATKNYSITELEMCGLVINIASFAHLLKEVDFDVIVDHLAIMYIMRSKAEPTITRIKRLLELLTSYSFNLYYIKGKDMVLSDFLSRQKTGNSNPPEIIPISFNLRRVLHENYYKISDLTRTIDSGTDKYLVQTRSQAKASSVKVPEVHSANKGLIPHVKPECQKPVAIPHEYPIPPIHHTVHTDQRLPTNAVLPLPKPRIGQGRAGIRRKLKATLPIPKPIEMPTPPIPMPAPRTVQELTEPVTQSQDSILPEHHVPTVLQPLVQPTPASITQPIEPITDHRPI